MSCDILVIGGGPAGLSAAVNARARGRSVLVVSNPLEENPLWPAERVDNYPGLPAVSGAELLTQLRRHAERSGAEFLTGRALTSVRMGDAWYVSVGPDMYNAKAVVLAAGVARGKKFPGEAEFLGRGVSYCATCDGMLYRDRPVAAVVLGAGFDEDVRFLQGICQVDVLTRPPRALRAEGERVILSTADSDTAYDCVFILRPAVALTTLLPALETADGAVRVDADMQTNIPGVFAAGDITGAPYQAARAVGQGNTAALSIARFLHQGDAINHESTN